MLAIFGLVGLILWIWMLGGGAPNTLAAVTAEPERTPLEQAKWMCKFLHTRYDDKPVSQIPLKDLDMIGNCKNLGLW